jgi:hypothetical protein
MPAAKTTLDDVIKDTGARTIHYLYDFGDGWDHVIKIERIGESDPQARYPQLVTAQGRCPPEDVGGPPGYAEFLAAIADPAHEDHDHMLTWCGGAFDPEILTSSTLRTNSTASRADGLRARASSRPPRPAPDHVRARPSTPAVAPWPPPEGYDCQGSGGGVH